MKLKSERLTYTRHTPNSFEDYKRMTMNYEIMKFIHGKALTEEEVIERFAKVLTANTMDDVLGYYAVIKNDTAEVIGLAKLLYFAAEKGSIEGKEKGIVEVGYLLEPEFWGKGYATEITKYFTKFAKGFSGIKEVIGIVNPENEASKNVLLKCGYELYNTSLFENKPAEWYKLKLIR